MQARLLAQRKERRSSKPKVEGSSPSGATKQQWGSALTLPLQEEPLELNARMKSALRLCKEYGTMFQDELGDDAAKELTLKIYNIAANDDSPLTADLLPLTREELDLVWNSISHPADA